MLTFVKNLDKDLCDTLLVQLHNLWTHTSTDWFALYHNFDQTILKGDTEKALTAYVQLHVAFVRIHPFFDGNGRIARLVSNIPVLKAGFPPIIIPRELRKEYIDLLSAYHFGVGQIQANSELLPNIKELQPFTAFCKQAWQESIALVEEVIKIQQAR